MLGPRTTKWVTEYIVDQDGSARSRHTKWKHEAGLNVTDPGVADHELVMRVVTLALEYDQLNISELACFELLMRRAQMSEWKYRERILGRAGTVLDELDDEHLYMGVSEVRGLLMVSPLLSEHISAELHREAVSLKERRKLREERRSSQGKASGSGGGGGGDGNKGDQSRLDRLASENKKLKEQLEGAGMELPKTGGPHKQRGGGKGGPEDA